MKNLPTLFALLMVAAGVASFASDDQPTDPDSTPAGFVSILPGTDLAGWVGGTTIDPSKIEPARQAEWDREAPKHWRAEGDVLVSDGQSPHLVTARTYRDFELLIDWKLSPNGDSGIYLRDTPQVQLWDPANPAAHKNGSQKGSGGLWNNRGRGKWPLVVADNPTGEWNRMRIRMVGPYVRVVLNGKLVVDDAPLENYFDRSLPVLAEGRIHLQTHGSETRFRRLLIREIEHAESSDLIEQIESREAANQ